MQRDSTGGKSIGVLSMPVRLSAISQRENSNLMASLRNGVWSILKWGVVNIKNLCPECELNPALEGRGEASTPVRGLIPGSPVKDEPPLAGYSMQRSRPEHAAFRTMGTSTLGH